MLGLISFNCFINDIEKGARSTLMNFTENTKLGNVLNVSEEHNIIKMNPER